MPFVQPFSAAHIALRYVDNRVGFPAGRKTDTNLLRQALGRDLTRDETKSLGFPFPTISIAEVRASRAPDVSHRSKSLAEPDRIP